MARVKQLQYSSISTIVEPNDGEVRIVGYDLKKNPLECKKNIGVVTQE